MSSAHTANASPTDKPLPPAAVMGLLNYLTATSLDEDYAAAAAKRRRGATAAVADGAGGARRPRWLALLVLAVFGLLASTAAVQTARTATVSADSRSNLIAQITAGQHQLSKARSQLSSLRTQVNKASLQSRVADADRQTAEQRVERLGISSGTTAVSGPGVRIVVDDQPGAANDAHTVLDVDLQNIVNGLFAAGAEAVAVDGQRIGSLTAIRQAGDAITVNYQRVTRPYAVLAIGDPKRLPARFADSTTGAFWLNAREQFGLRFDMNSEDSLTIPATAQPPLRHAKQLDGATQ